MMKIIIELNSKSLFRSHFYSLKIEKQEKDELRMRTQSTKFESLIFYKWKI